MKINQPTISSREKEVLERISHGLTTREVASELYLSHHTIITHRKNLMSKFGALNTAHLIRIAFESNILEAHSSSALIIPLKRHINRSQTTRAI